MTTHTRTFSAKTLALCALFTALVAVCSQITIPLPLKYHEPSRSSAESAAV